MGAQNSNLRRTIEDEFAARTQDGGRSWLRLDELLALQLPHSNWSLQLSHLGVLYVLDREHDGRFSMSDILEMLALGRARSRLYQPHEFAGQLAGYCTLQLWKGMCADGGRVAFVDWLCRLMVENADTEEFACYPGHTFLNIDCIRTLHQILDIQENQGLDFQAFFDLLQRIAEAQGLTDPEDEALDDWLPAEALRECGGAVADGVMATMRTVCPSNAATLQF